MRCPRCEAKVSMLVACARCQSPNGEGCCCVGCYQVCKRLELRDQEMAAQDAAAERPPTVH
jgi:hypothetical protein